jgi:uncharacterized membrane protein YccF (DUF307 family)
MQPVAPYAYAQPTTAYPNAVPGAAPSGAYPVYVYGPAPQVVNNINVSTAPPVVPATPFVVVAGQNTGPNLLVRALWFLFIGLWLGPLWIVLAWLLLVTIIGLPLGLLMINRIPQVMTLKPLRTRTTVAMHNGVMLVSQARPLQYPFLARALYFLVVGWWASLVWLVLTYTIIVATLGFGLPLAFWMCDQVPAVTTLARQ